jgi:hypothetical protein
MLDLIKQPDFYPFIVVGYGVTFFVLFLLVWISVRDVRKKRRQIYSYKSRKKPGQV